LFWAGGENGSAQNGLFANWNDGEPNNSGGNEDCVEMMASSGLWNDQRCYVSRSYLCETF
jgi:hypothetical protein